MYMAWCSNAVRRSRVPRHDSMERALVQSEAASRHFCDFLKSMEIAPAKTSLQSQHDESSSSTVQLRDAEHVEPVNPRSRMGRDFVITSAYKEGRSGNLFCARARCYAVFIAFSPQYCQTWDALRFWEALLRNTGGGGALWADHANRKSVDR